jgi:signal transduction histidine kinase
MDTTNPASLRELLRQLALAVGIAVLIAVALTAIPGLAFRTNLTYSLAVSLSSFAACVVLQIARGLPVPDWKAYVVAVPVGALLGVTLGSFALGTDPLRLFREHPNLLATALALSALFGTAVSYYFYSRGALGEAAAARRNEELARVSYERRLAEANLKMLQAQIEPHFLFNSLSNVLGLIATEPDKAERMLQDLTEVLRASLQRTRAGKVTLGEELLLVRAQLGIQSVRMGPRLRWAIDVPADLHGVELPPLVLQPLVENAIEHGLEPNAAGGEVRVSAGRSGDSLLLEVRDTGLGFSPSAGPGVGLANVRSRLDAVYRGKASLTVQPNAPSGVRVSIAIPLEAPAAPAPA